jgi:hypothetical protein
MKPSLFFISFLITSTILTTVEAQNRSAISTSLLIQQITDSLSAHTSYHYKAQMRFKEMGGDTFEARNFSINYKTDEANPLYGYNWEISEKVDSGYTYTWMVLTENVYVIFDGNKVIGYQSLPKIIDLDNYFESLRSDFILGEVFSPFANTPTEDIMMQDSTNYYYLTRQMSDMTSRQLIISKETYLPIQSIIIDRDSSFQFAQVQEINFYYDDDLWILPDTAFSIEHYLSLGYSQSLAIWWKRSS